MPDENRLAGRVTHLERQLRRTRLTLAVVGIASAAVATGGWMHKGEPDVLRVRGLVVVDAEGRERIVIGAPIVDPPGVARRSAVTGMVVRDGAGAERFGVGLTADGTTAMGLDAAPGAGTGSNRERITMSVGSNGSAEFRMLNHASRVAAHMSLFSDNTVGLFFTDHRPEVTVVHRVSAAGDTTVVHPR